MKKRPIIFSAPMVRALLDGTKTQTRRVVKTKYIDAAPPVHFYRFLRESCPYGQPKDELWVRENGWERPERTPKMMHDGADTWPPYQYDAVDHQGDIDYQLKEWGWKRRPSIHMPRWASRITLEITGIRVERLQEISEADAIAEGCVPRLSGTWWQGYRDFDEDLMHQQWQGEAPPDWMIEPHKMKPTPWLDRTAKQAYETLWDQINGPGAWAANPWVWCIEFKGVAS